MAKPSEKIDLPRISPEYAEFLLAEIRSKELKTWYEKLCKFSEKLNLSPPKQFAEKLNYYVIYSSLNVTPKGVFSASFLILFILSFFCFLVAFSLYSTIFFLLSFFLPLLVFWYLYSYPSRKAKEIKRKIAEESREIIVQIVTFLKSDISFERALALAARETTGLISEDIRKIVWDLEQENYKSIDEALSVYRRKWLWWNEKFVRSFDLLQTISSERRLKIKEEILKKALEGL